MSVSRMSLLTMILGFGGCALIAVGNLAVAWTMAQDRTQRNDK